MAQSSKLAAMKDAPTKPPGKECTGYMEQNELSNLAAMKVATENPGWEEYASSMSQRSKLRVIKDPPTKPRREEYI